MANSNGILTEVGQGPQPLTPVQAHWFTPIFTDGGGNTVVSDPYTANYNGGNAPFNVTLTTTNIAANDSAGATVPIASYATGYNFHIASATLADGDKVIFYDKANGTYPQSSAVDIDAQVVDSQGNPVGAPVTLQSDVQDVRQFRVGSAALGGDGYVLTYATVDATAKTETVHYQGYTAAGTPIAGQGGTLDSFTINNTTGESFGFGTLHPSTGADPSFVYLRGSSDNGLFPNNVGVKYEAVSTTGQAMSGLALIEPPYPSGSTSPNLLNFSFDRLTPTASSANDLAIIMRYSYVDAAGATHQAIDVHTLDTATGAGSDHVLALASGDTDTDLTTTVLANGDIALGYNDGSNQPLKVQIFDTNGKAVGAPLALPSDEAGFQLDTNAAGQLIVQWTADTGGGQQLEYDAYDVGTAAPTGGQPPATTGGQTATLQPFTTVFNHGQPDKQFVFEQGDGIDVIRGFKLAGADHDTLQLPSSDFRTFADVLRNTGDIGGSAFITDPVTGDAIRLAGVTKAELKAHPMDVAFHA